MGWEPVSGARRFAPQRARPARPVAGSSAWAWVITPPGRADDLGSMAGAASPADHQGQVVLVLLREHALEALGLAGAGRTPAQRVALQLVDAQGPLAPVLLRALVDAHVHRPGAGAGIDGERP